MRFEILPNLFFTLVVLLLLSRGSAFRHQSRSSRAQVRFAPLWSSPSSLPSGKEPLSTTEDDGYSLRNRAPKWLRNLWNRAIARKAPGSLLLIRHGESDLNSNGTFTGWIDSDMNENGVQDMEYAARLMKERGFSVDIAYTSRLKRAIRSTWTILSVLDQIFRPVYKSWRLNERCYGAMEGRSKAQLAIEIGEDKVQEVRKSLTARPPPMTEDHPHWHRNERKYADLKPEDIPVTESVADCLARTLPLWKNRIIPEIISGKNVMVVAHANSLRGLIQHIDSLSEDDVKKIYVPNAIPLVYKFDENLKPIRGSESVGPMSAAFLGDPKAIKLRLDMEKQWGEQVPGLAEAVSQPAAAAAAITTVRPNISVMSKLPVVSSELERIDNLIATNSVRSTHNPTDPIIILIRHGKTENNKLGIFTGWDDAPLAKEGRIEAKKAGKLLKLHGIEFDVVYTSWLSRAIETAWTVLDELDLLWLPIIKSWRLNERMYGVLTGMSKKMIAEKFGAEQFKKWRRGYKTQPPPVTSFSPYYPGNDDRYFNYVVDVRYSFTESFIRSFATGKLELHRKFPKTESLKDCMKRTIPYFTDTIVPTSLQKGERVLIASSENAIRGLLMHLCDIPESRISDLEIPTGLPLIYSIKRRCIQLLDDGIDEGEDPLSRYNFGKSPELLFRPCNQESGGESCITVNGKSYEFDPIIRLETNAS